MANNAANTIEVFGPSGTDFGSIAVSGINAPIGLAFDSEGSLYIVNAGSTTIEKITTSAVASIFAFTSFSPAFRWWQLLDPGQHFHSPQRPAAPFEGRKSRSRVSCATRRVG